MLSIARLSTSASQVAEYYAPYLGAEGPATFFGGGAEIENVLGLPVSTAVMKMCLDGFGPDGLPRVQNAGRENHRCGLDIVLTSPKDWSVLEALSSLREKLISIRLAGGEEAINYLESSAAFARVDKDGTRIEPVKLIGARVQHSTSREDDMNPHEHNVLFNYGYRKNGLTAALWSKPLYRHQKAARALYWATLAAGLKELGFTVEARKHGFHIVGVPPEVSAHFSKRRKQIEAELKAHGAHSGRAGDIANLATRRSKSGRSAAELREDWHEQLSELGYSIEQIEQSVRKRHRIQGHQSCQELVAQAVEQLTKRQNSFLPRELIQRVAEASIPHGFDGATVQQEVGRYLRSTEGIVKLEEHALGTIYTTQAVLDQEQKLLRDVAVVAANKRHTVSQKTIDRVLTRDKSAKALTDQQRHAVTHLTKNSGGLACLEALPGTNDLAVCRAAKEIWTREGYRVQGIGVTGAVANKMASECGIPSDTLGKWLAHLSTTWLDRHKYAAKQFIQGKPAPTFDDTFKLTKRTILCLSDASQVSVKEMEELTSHVKRAGAKLVLLTGTQQWQAMTQPGAFRHIAQQIEPAKLTHIEAQTLKANDPFHEPDWQRVAAKELVEGKAEKALNRYAKRGFVTVGEDRADAINRLVADWSRDGAGDLVNNGILVVTARDATRVNLKCQEARKAAGQLRSLHHGVRIQDADCFVNDRVLFTRSSRWLGVADNDFGTVTAVDDEYQRVKVRLDSGKKVEIDLSRYSHLRLGYACTANRRTSGSLRNVYCLLGGAFQDQAMSLVQATCARENSRFYIPKQEAGPDLSVIKAQMRMNTDHQLASAFYHHTHSR